MSGIYASGIAGLSFLKKNIEKLKGKKLIVFCCGASPFDKEAYEAVAKKNPEEYEPWEKALMCAVGQKCDWTDREYLDPILDYIGMSR